MGYSEYEGNVSTKKEITSIVLSKVDDEADFKATFSQTILVDSKSIGKKNEDNLSKELSVITSEVKDFSKAFGALVDKITEFLNTYDDNEEYKLFVQQGTTSSENVDGRFQYWRAIVNELN